MASDSLLIAEQCIDRQTRPYLFRGRQIESVTGRVLLHAIDSAGRAVCGCGREHLTLIGQPWHATYLPHFPRCRGCAQLSDAVADGQPGQDSDLPAPASGVDIRTARGTAAENDGRAALREVLAGYDLRRWMFTDLVVIDETIRGGVSHSLTLSPASLMRSPARALSMFVHEQLHWMEGSGTEAAAAESSRRWPDPPSPPAGAADPRSTWIHLSVCALEYFSLAEILGPAAVEAELRQYEGYSWIYGQILAGPGWFSDLLLRHGLQVPRQPPVPRRYFGKQWRAISCRPDLASAQASDTTRANPQVKVSRSCELVIVINAGPEGRRDNTSPQKPTASTGSSKTNGDIHGTRRSPGLVDRRRSDGQSQVTGGASGQDLYQYRAETPR